jgi:hypothetical protein
VDGLRYRWVPRLFVLAAAILVPWTLALGYRLPANHTTHHWDIAWVGFDVTLASSLALTGLTIARRSLWAEAAAAVSATLLLTDAWFDNLLSSGSGEHLEAALEAAFVEIPLAFVCLWLARNAEQVMETVLRARGARAGATGARAERREARARPPRPG